MAKPIDTQQADPRCARCLPAWGNQPSPDAYLKLMNSLFAQEVFVKSQKIDRLDAGTAALRSVLTYLNSDPISVRLGLTKLLASIAHALHDTSQGAKPPLFFDRTAKRRGGAPSHLTEAGLRAQVNLMFKMLTRAGETDDDASRWIAAELKRSGVLQKKAKGLPNGKPIEASQIRRWSSEKGGKSLSGSDQVYRKLEEVENRRGWPVNSPAARARVQTLIRSLQAAGF